MPDEKCTQPAAPYCRWKAEGGTLVGRIETVEQDCKEATKQVNLNTTALAVLASRVATIGGVGALVGSAIGAGAVAAIAKLGGG